MTAGTVATSGVTAGVLALLVGADLLVDVGRVPDDAGWVEGPGVGQYRPYATLYPLPGTTDGSVASASADGRHVYQVTAVGATVDQAEWVADKARAALCGSRFDAGARRVTLITCPVLTGVMPDDTVKPRVFFSADRFDVLSTPTSPG